MTAAAEKHTPTDATPGNLFRNPLARAFFDHRRWLENETEVLLARSVAFRRFWTELDGFLVRNREPFAGLADASYYFLAKWSAEDAAEDITVDRNTPKGDLDNHEVQS